MQPLTLTRNGPAPDPVEALPQRSELAPLLLSGRGSLPPLTAADPVEAMLIPATEAAALAGVSRATWHRLRAAGKVPPAVKLGRAVRWRRADLVLWIELGCPDRQTFDASMNANGRPRTAGR
jgi:predicted DNA-binding transcriptional regulator AlpA